MLDSVVFGIDFTVSVKLLLSSSPLHFTPVSMKLCQSCFVRISATLNLFSGWQVLDMSPAAVPVYLLNVVQHPPCYSVHEQDSELHPAQGVTI